MSSLLEVVNTSWDNADLVRFHLLTHMGRRLDKSSAFCLKAEDMSSKLSTFKDGLLESLSRIPEDTQGEEFWCTFERDMTSMCSLLTSSMRITFVEIVNCSDIDTMAMNLFVTTDNLLSDWAQDFESENFKRLALEACGESVLLCYSSLLRSMSLFCDASICQESLASVFRWTRLEATKKRWADSGAVVK
jgi:hypothetical protein